MTAVSKTDLLEGDTRSFLLQVRSLHEELLDLLDYDFVEAKKKDEEKLRAYLTEQVHALLKEKQEKNQEHIERLTQAVLDEMLGFGPAEILLRDSDITDIFINGPTKIYIEKRGQVQRSDVCFLDNDHIYRLVQRVAAESGRHLNLGTPYFDAQLEDGSRLHAIIPPLAIDGIKVSIRKFLFKKLDLQSLVQSGSLTEQMSKFLHIAVRSRFNMVICGGTGSGKTTLLNSLLGSIRKGERVVTIEDVAELEPTHPHTVRLLTRLPNPEGKGGVSQADLMINALRMRPDRVILGELRGPEAFNLLHAMNTGQDGSMVTLHASGAEEVIPRLLNMILMARYGLSPESVMNQIAEALDLVIHVGRFVDGSRRVISISQITGISDGKLKIDDIFKFSIKSISEKKVDGKFLSLFPLIPKRFLNKLNFSGMTDEYFSLIPSENTREV